jgi:hypothetical protein
MIGPRSQVFLLVAGASLWLSAARPVLAHCDTMDGPVVAAARAAVERGDVAPVLKWIAPEAEPEARAALARTLAVRALSPQARELADRWFFETVVRLHRLREGEPYEGLKPVGTDPGPAVRAADRSIEEGSADPVIRLLSERTAAGVRRQIARVLQTRRRAEESAEAGRAFTKAYADYVHYVEELYRASEESREAPATVEHHH